MPNPGYTSSTTKTQHPLTLHLTPTSTVNIKVTSLEPVQSSTQPFVKISPDAEVIVAPKSRGTESDKREGRSIASTSRRSAGGRSATSAARHRSHHEETRPPTFLRGIDRSVCDEWYDQDDAMSDNVGLRVWLDRDHLLSKSLKGVTWVSVSVIRPAGLQEPIDTQKQTPEQDKPATKVVARLIPWEDAPDSRHVAMSSMLCASLGASGIVGGIVRIEAAPLQSPKTTSALKPSKDGSKEVAVRELRISPFLDTKQAQSGAITFGGETKAEQERAVQRFKALFGGSENSGSLLDGSLTHGMMIPAEAGNSSDSAWPGGILRFDPAPSVSTDPKRPTHWLLGADRKLGIQMQPAVARPAELGRTSPGEPLPVTPSLLVGIDPIIQQLRSHLLHSSSILLTGGIGSGKTSLAQLLALSLQKEHFYYTLFYPCRTLLNDEIRVPAVKETLQRIFGLASWGARLGGKSIVVLDDLDRLCPAETELQVGDENGRSRQISELICSIARENCSRDSGVVLLATAQAKETVNNVIIGGHVVRDIVTIKAPNKDGRKQVLETLLRQTDGKQEIRHRRLQSAQSDQAAWMDGSEVDIRSEAPADGGFTIDSLIDLLDIAGQTDGYMPGDLKLLVSRTHSEALIRSVSNDEEAPSVTLSNDDFSAALKGFTPASLRNVTLQTSSTSFSSIGGLHETRQILLETLQYPTTYAPIFAKCPLRLRSGLLLYGYPGCGKTMLASAVAGECGLNFISVKGPEILNKYIGASEKSVRDLFDRAEAARPCVLFFDEFDSIAPKRGHDSTGVTDRVVNQLLTQMDGAEGLSGVYVLAATSRPDLIDPALLRPGRLDKSLLCDMPALEDRLDILTAVTGKLRLDSSLTQGGGSETLTEIARQTPGYSGADLQAVMYNAHLEAIHDVLGDGANGTDNNQMGKSQNERSASSKPRHNDFSYFRFGDDEAGLVNGTMDPAHAPPAVLAERAAIAARLAAMDTARRRAKQQRHAAQQQSAGQSLGNMSNGDGGGGAETKTQEPVIAWKHVVASLKTTRPSIARQERIRLGQIYGEFVTGRNGEMPNGQGGSEIGGRSSLM